MFRPCSAVINSSYSYHLKQGKSLNKHCSLYVGTSKQGTSQITFFEISSVSVLVKAAEKCGWCVCVCVYMPNVAWIPFLQELIWINILVEWIIDFKTEFRVVTYFETYVLRSVLLHKLDLCHFVWFMFMYMYVCVCVCVYIYIWTK